jgi:RHS repeat-associated protein
VLKRYLPNGLVISTGTNYVFTRDHLASVRDVITGSTVVARYDYDAWGVRTNVSGTVRVEEGFTGHFFHERSALLLAPYRAYDPEQGRWLSRDPIAENGGINLYSYVGNNPINFVDPLGLIDLDVYVWAWEGAGFVRADDRVGHIMLTEAGTKNVFLSQYPEKKQPYSKNVRHDYDETIKEGVPSKKFQVHLPNDIDFMMAVFDHMNRDTWAGVPYGRNQTHCSRAAYDALKAGGLKLRGQDRGQILPDTLKKQLEKLSNDKDSGVKELK